MVECICDLQFPLSLLIVVFVTEYPKNSGFIKKIVKNIQEQKMAIEQQMVDIIVEQLSVDKDKVVPGASFVDDLGADSLDLVELIMAMEEEFDVEIPDEEAEKIATVQNAIDFVNNLK